MIRREKVENADSTKNDTDSEEEDKTDEYDAITRWVFVM